MKESPSLYAHIYIVLELFLKFLFVFSLGLIDSSLFISNIIILPIAEALLVVTTQNQSEHGSNINEVLLDNS